MEKNSSKKGDIKISLLGLLIGISLIVAGVYGIVSNKIENQEYKNSTDIRTVNAVVEECRRKDEKNESFLFRSLVKVLRQCAAASVLSAEDHLSDGQSRSRAQSEAACL